MSTINLADAKVSYGGQILPAINLLGKLQTELQELACRLAAISSTLGDLQAALLNSTTVEVKLTLSKEDFGRFRSLLEGQDDNERIRQAVMTLIHPVETSASPNCSQPEAPKLTPHPPRSVEEDRLPCQPASVQPPITRPTNTVCPICQSPIEIPETARDQLSVEVKCPNCGAKSLLKPKR